jgi:hypothetical protein
LVRQEHSTCLGDAAPGLGWYTLAELEAHLWKRMSNKSKVKVPKSSLRSAATMRVKRANKFEANWRHQMVNDASAGSCSLNPVDSDRCCLWIVFPLSNRFEQRLNDYVSHRVDGRVLALLSVATEHDLSSRWSKLFVVSVATGVALMQAQDRLAIVATLYIPSRRTAPRLSLAVS